MLIGVVAILCLPHRVIAQNLEIVPFQIGERVPDLPLKNMINYKDSAATLSSFGDKLIILDFWHTRCGTCIALFPLEDSLQKRFSKQLQFILVTAENKNVTGSFLDNWNRKHHDSLTIPVIAEDILLNKMFRHRYNPHYVWIASDGRLLAQTGEEFVNESIISQVIKSIADKQSYLKNKTFLPPEYYHFPALSEVQQLFIQNYQN